jgi:hypothetical protein
LYFFSYKRLTSRYHPADVLYMSHFRCDVKDRPEALTDADVALFADPVAVAIWLGYLIRTYQHCTLPRAQSFIDIRPVANKTSNGGIPREHTKEQGSVTRTFPKPPKRQRDEDKIKALKPRQRRLKYKTHREDV